MVRVRNSEATRAALLSAAATVLQAQGAGLSLDAVAREAGVSKGGLLHHFPSREALLDALALDLLARFERRVEALREREVAEHGERPGAWLRAYIAASFDSDPEEDALYEALKSLPAIWDQLGVMGEAHARLSARAEADGVPAARAHAVRLACDGLWLGGFSLGQRGAVREELMTWTRV
ncbi:TetR/AcrR family transcriptional regulator [Deinococcus sp. YIM 134068]|uniref:TetR/AcrR family transcriptional regulator n=1 Tax=Deinococcus lichenicola TaxID=3118910 RepID=UPI002F93DB0F